MTSRKLSNGIKYKIDRVAPGTIVPGTDQEPVVTITVRGGTIRYRLASYLLDRADTPTWEGDISQQEIDDADSWVCANLPMLLAEANLCHIIRFDQNSSCYYDFQSQTLYEADGLYEKKGSTARGLKNVAEIGGDRISLPEKVQPFLKILTRKPGVGFSYERFLPEETDDIEGAKKRLSQAFYKFLRYDSSIRDTFIKEKTGSKLYKYVGEPQVWFVGEMARNETLTLQKLYAAVARQEVLVICDPVKGALTDSVLPAEITAAQAAAFLGLDAGLLDPSQTDMQRFFDCNDFSSADVLKSLLSRYSTMLDAVWAQISKNIKNNLLHSLSASTYFKDTQEVPHQQSMYLGAYPLNERRLEIVLNQIYPSVTNLIEEFGLQARFFQNCDLAIRAKDGAIDIKKAIDGIVALLLICFSGCKTPTADEEAVRIKAQYRKKLLELIRKRFGYIPPDGGPNGIFGTLQSELQELLELGAHLDQIGLHQEAAVIEKYINGLKLGYGDENSLCPPTMDRDR